MSYCTPHENADGSEPFGKQWNEKKLLRNKRSSRSEQNGKKKQGIIWPKKKSCKMTDFSLLPIIPPEVHRMVSPGRKWVWNLGKIWKKMSDLLVYSYLSLVTETGSLFVGSKSELISGASSSAVKFCWMISSVFCFFCNSCFSRRVAACSDSRFSICFWILLELGILVTPRSWSSFLVNRGAGILPDAWYGKLLDF